MQVDEEAVLRSRIMASLAVRTAVNGGVITRVELNDFRISPTESRRLIDASRGIWNPRDLQATLTVLSSPNGPYDDSEIEGGLFRYAYRTGTTDGDNAKLRKAAELELPIILLRKIQPGVFVPIFPVFVLTDDPTRRQFVLALDESLRFLSDPLNPSIAERRYAERVVRQRLHQSEFRGRVILAYSTRCAVCSLGHGELLDAAHIIGDASDDGDPVVSNGLSLCKIHHAAYDRNLLGISPLLRVSINARLLAEVDGPMLEHGLKGMHGGSIAIPTRRADRPDSQRLEVRFQEFLAAG